MSIPVSLAELPEQVERFGPNCYLLTVGREAAPRAVAVRVRWDGLLLAAGVGRHTAANVRGNDAVALLWPPEPASGHCLIVDGWGDLRAGSADPQVLIQPYQAVLHLTARAWGSPDRS